MMSLKTQDKSKLTFRSGSTWPRNRHRHLGHRFRRAIPIRFRNRHRHLSHPTDMGAAQRPIRNRRLQRHLDLRTQLIWLHSYAMFIWERDRLAQTIQAGVQVSYFTIRPPEVQIRMADRDKPYQARRMDRAPRDLCVIWIGWWQYQTWKPLGKVQWGMTTQHPHMTYLHN